MIGLRTPDPREELLAARLAHAEADEQKSLKEGDVPAALNAKARVRRASQALNEYWNEKERQQ